jgi:hypothetical protein
MIKGKLFYDNDFNKKVFYGNIGEFAFEVDDIRYYVGDTITSNFDNNEEFVIKDEGKYPCVMGFVTSTSHERARLDIFRKYNIQKYKSYTEIQEGEKHNCVVVHFEYFNENKRIKE